MVARPAMSVGSPTSSCQRNSGKRAFRGLTALLTLALLATSAAAERAGDLLKQAEAYQKSGKLEEAWSTLKKAVGRQKELTPREKSTLAKMLQHNRDLMVEARDKKGGSAKHSKPAAAPSKDVSKLASARTTLRTARLHLGHGNWEAAGQLGVQLQKTKVKWEKDEDTPDKLLRDVRRAAKDPHWLLKACRLALKKGDLKRAEILARRSDDEASLGTWVFSKDSPDKVLEEIKQARIKKAVPPGGSERSSKPQPTKEKTAARRERQPQTKAPVKADTKKSVKGSRKEALALLEKGRQALKSGKLDEVENIVAQVRRMKDVSYYILDDQPDALQNDLNEARRQKDKEESVKVLAQAQKLYAAGKWDEARRMAYRAQRLHGPYNVWEYRSRHRLQSLLKRIEEGKLEAEKKQLAKGSGGSKPSEEPKTGKQARPLDPKTRQAKLWVIEARQLQKQGRLLEAMQKARQALALEVKFPVDEKSPGELLRELSAQARQHEGACMTNAAKLVAQSNSPARFQQAEQQLLQARQLAVAFGHDPRPIDAQLQQVAYFKSSAGVANAQSNGPPMEKMKVAQLPVPADADPKGVDLLDKSRIELKAGQIGLARRLAEEALVGKYGVRQLAEIRLREIDDEESRLNRNKERAAFDAAVSMFHQHRFAEARGIFVQLNDRYLDDYRRGRMQEIMSSPEMGNSSFAVADNKGVRKMLPATPGLGETSEPGKAQAGDGPGDALMASVNSRRIVLVEKLRSESLKARQDAAERARSGDMEGAIEILEDFLRGLDAHNLDTNQMAVLRRPVANRMQQFQLLRDQKRLEAKSSPTTVVSNLTRSKESLRRRQKEKNVGTLMEQYYALYKEGKYQSAMRLAQQAHELDPDNSAAQMALKLTQIRMELLESQRLRRNRGKFENDQLNDAENEGPVVTSKDPINIDLERHKISSQRGPVKNIPLPKKKTKIERQIESMMDSPTTFNVEDVPLKDAVDTIRQIKQININFDYKALQDDVISVDRPVSLNLENVSLKSVLNMLLRQANLTWIIQDESLLITTDRYAKGKLRREVYQVVDLITPIENFALPVTSDMNAALARSGGMGQQTQMQPSVSPFMSPSNLQGGQPIGNGTRSLQDAYEKPEPQPLGSFGSVTDRSMPGATWQKRQTSTLERQLMELIVNAIEPQSWSTTAGSGTILYHPLTHALIVNQTQDIQEQIADLLAALRRLQDQEVAIEVRFISIADGFFERIGLDFSLNIKTNRQTRRFEPQITTGQFAPAPFINDFNPSRLIVGTTPAGTFTSDLDIPIRPTSFARGIPPFGGYSNAGGPDGVGDGGLTLGLAFLSDIQVFMFMEAAQGDQRTNVMQAPKLTMFNGQTATLSVQTQQFFVTNVSAVQNGGQLVFLPQNIPFPFGVNLTLQAVISADRRFVRVSLSPNLTNLASAIVPLFPIVTAVQPFFEGVGNVGQPTLFTQFLQQPIIQTISVQTTVVVPDGGTVLLGGLKRLSEGRNEFGPPVLSKLPYINRLFKNVGYGRETESLLLMVTPRIIINEEEEIIQTGVVSSPQLEQ